MTPPWLRPLSGLLAVAGAAAGLTALAPVMPARAAANQFDFGANAYGSFAFIGSKLLGAGSGKSALVSLGCTLKPQTHTNSTVGVSLPLLNTTGGAVTDTVSSAFDKSTGTATASAQSSIATVSALGGLIKASAITASAAASEGPSGGSVSGSATLLGLTVAGKTISANPAPNTKIAIAGVGTLVLNQQSKSVKGGQAQISVNAIDLTLAAGNSLGLPVGAQLILAHAAASVSGPVSGLLGGRAFGSSLTGNPLVTSGPSFPANVGCLGTGGKTVTNRGAGVNAGPLTVGAITDTAEGIDTSSQLSAQTSSTTASVGVSTVLSATAVSTNASASVVSGKLHDSGGTTIASLDVLGVPVTLPVIIPPNFNVPILGGTLTLNRQVRTSHGIVVEGIYLSLPAIGTVTIASSSASA